MYKYGGIHLDENGISPSNLNDIFSSRHQ
jgi:hypothetical protein